MRNVSHKVIKCNNLSKVNPQENWKVERLKRRHEQLQVTQWLRSRAKRQLSSLSWAYKSLLPRLGATSRRHSLPVRKSQRPGASSTVQAVVDLGLLIVTARFSGKETCGGTLIQQQCWLDCNWRQETEWIVQSSISLELKVLNFFGFLILQFCSF